MYMYIHNIHVQEEGRELDKEEGHLHTCKCIGIYTCNTITIHEGRERHLHCFVKGHKLLILFNFCKTDIL